MPIKSPDDLYEQDEKALIKPPFDPEREMNLLFLFRSTRFRAAMSVIDHFFHALPVFKDLFLIFRPESTWNRIVAGQKGALFIFLFYLAPMLLLAGMVEGYALVLLGRKQVAQGQYARFTPGQVFIYELGSALMLLLVIVITAKVVQSFANACHKRSHLSQSLQVILHALGPMLFIQLLNGIPGISLWLTCFAGLVVTGGALYHGLPRIMHPDPPSAMGLYFGSVLVMSLMLIFWRFLTYCYIAGYCKSLEKMVADWATKLPF